MIKVKALLLVIMVVGLFQGKLFSIISSRVEGIITDKDTGTPIEGVTVSIMLYGGNVDLASWESKTDKKGYFKFEFDDIGQEYYVQCKKDGYIPFVPRYYRTELRRKFPDIFKKIVNLFYLKEGQIKHLKINLEKGGTLKGKILKKDASGLSVFVGAGIGLNRNRVEADNAIFPTNIDTFYMENITYTDQNGEFIITNLEPFYYNLILSASGFTSNELTNIEVKKGEIKTVEYTMDLANTSGIMGTIKINNAIPGNGVVALSLIENGKISPYEICGSKIKKDGVYSCMGLPSGKYHIFIGCEDISGINYEKELVIEIISGETKIYNINLNDGDKYEE